MSKPRLDGVDKKLAILQSQLDALRERENELQTLVRSVRLEQLALKAEHDDLEALRVPINWLPTELLCRIFVLFTDPFDDLDDTSCDATPVTLSHVCRKWRGIALGTPMLWRRVQLRPRDASYDEPGPHQVRSPQALAFLRRAQPVPLDIILKAVPDPILFHSSGHIQLMIQRRSDAFRFGHPSRTLHVLETLGDIRSILVDDWFTMTLDVFLLLCMREPVFPSLETLSLRIVDLNFYRPFLDYIISCRETPSLVKWKPQPFRKLQCLSLFGIPFDFLPTCDLPLLREFTFGQPLDCLYNPAFKIAHFARFLSSAPNLEKLSLLQAGPEFDIGIDTSLPPTFWDKAIDWILAGPNKVPLHQLSSHSTSPFSLLVSVQEPSLQFFTLPSRASRPCLNSAQPRILPGYSSLLPSFFQHSRLSVSTVRQATLSVIHFFTSTSQRAPANSAHHFPTQPLRHCGPSLSHFPL